MSICARECFISMLMRLSCHAHNHFRTTCSQVAVPRAGRPSTVAAASVHPQKADTTLLKVRPKLLLTAWKNASSLFWPSLTLSYVWTTHLSLLHLDHKTWLTFKTQDFSILKSNPFASGSRCVISLERNT